MKQVCMSCPYPPGCLAYGEGVKCAIDAAIPDEPTPPRRAGRPRVAPEARRVQRASVQMNDEEWRAFVDTYTRVVPTRGKMRPTTAVREALLNWVDLTEPQEAPMEQTPLPQKTPTMETCIAMAAGYPELVENWQRLTGERIATPAGAAKFMAFAIAAIWDRLPPDLREDPQNL